MGLETNGPLVAAYNHKATLIMATARIKSFTFLTRTEYYRPYHPTAVGHLEVIHQQQSNLV